MKRAIALIFAFLFALTILISCAANTVPEVKEMPKDEPSSGEIASDSASQGTNGGNDKTGLGNFSGNVTSESDRKLVYTADYVIETLNYDEDYQKIVSATKKYNGYFSYEDSHGTKPAEYGDSARASELTIRIPVDNYTSFTEELSGVGQIMQKNQNTEDITGSYLDVESRINLLETQYKKLDAHLQKATKMSDVIELEEEMSKILNELEELRGTRRKYDNMVNYTTINVHLTEVVKLSEVPTSKEGFWDRASNGFNSTMKSVGVFFEALGVFLIAASPVLIILALIAAIVIIIVRLCVKAKKRKASQNPAGVNSDGAGSELYQPHRMPVSEAPQQTYATQDAKDGQNAKQDKDE